MKLMGVKPEDLLSNLSNLVKEKMRESERLAGAKLTVMVAIDDNTDDLIFCFYKQGENNQFELYKQFNILNLLGNDTADNTLKSTTYIGSGAANTGNNTYAGHYDGTDSGRNDD